MFESVSILAVFVICFLSIRYCASVVASYWCDDLLSHARRVLLSTVGQTLSAVFAFA